MRLESTDGAFAMAGALTVGVAFAAVARRGVEGVCFCLAMIRRLPFRVVVRAGWKLLLPFGSLFMYYM